MRKYYVPFEVCEKNVALIKKKKLTMELKNVKNFLRVQQCFYFN